MPHKFNFAVDVIDKWADQRDDLQAMHWVSQDESNTRHMTFKYFSRQSHRIAILLDQLGFGKGDTMTMVLPRVPAWWEVALAAIRSGIILSPGPNLLTEKEIQYRCNKTKSRLFVGDETSVSKFLAVRQHCPTVKHIIRVGDGTRSQDVSSLYAALEDIETHARFDSLYQEWSSPAMIYFTSGTSGHPKMVRHNQVMLSLARGIAFGQWYQLAPGKVLWNTADQGWAKAAWSFFGAWNSGATLFVHDDRGAFSAKRTVDILCRYPITTLCAAPLIFRQLVSPELEDHFKRNPPAALAHCTTAGEALNAIVTQRWRQLTGLDIYEGYGQTETALLCANLKGSTIRPGSMGKPAPGVPLHIITATGAEAAHNEEGDIAVLLSDRKGSSNFFGIFDGYVQEDNTCTRNERTVTVDGEVKSYYLTGDRATRDQDGYFWFVGRADDVINSSGYRIGPFEVESTLKLHPAVAEAAVISSPDPGRGEVVKAFVVRTREYENAPPQELEQELQTFCKKNAAPYKYPRKLEFVEGSFLPRTTSGKIQRALLRKLEWRKEAGSKL
ncbi:acetyl-CoA synthetase-like protein [Alternaria alternata]|uniref:medium-chain acyl-CoA ligase n=1 Tax=Alternaria alternata TaxID=5599 RepID=A0A177DSK6_ALTAL|nr:acetyl-CoA synthetase-like protein [Alternaria alternata]OAG22764.1 acetyl-CoA synthetase-like protein [Alternaria alternata]